MVPVFAESEESNQHYVDEELQANQDNRGQTIHFELGKFLCSKITSSNEV